MEIKGFGDLIRELLQKPLGGVFTWLAGAITVSTWIFGGDYWQWEIPTKILISIVIALCFLFARVFYIAYSVHTKAKQLHTEINRLKSDPPLRVRKVSQGTDYYEGDVMVILEPHNSISTGDVLTLFVREGDMEIPICLLSVEAITNKDFLQSVVFHALTERPLLGYLTDQNRLEQLQAKRNISRSYLEGGN